MPGGRAASFGKRRSRFVGVHGSEVGAKFFHACISLNGERNVNTQR
jgi:hypothetical protein